MVIDRLFAGQAPLTQVPCASVAEGPDLFPYRGMKVVITENRDKVCRVVNGQDATLVSNQGNTLIVRFPDDERAFLYPVMHPEEGKGDVT